jgi:hypothetical protein
VERNDDLKKNRNSSFRDRYEEAISNLEKELAEKGLSRDEIKSLEAVVYGRGEDMMEGPVARTGGLVAEGAPDVPFPPRRDADFIDDISRERRGNLFSTGREETGMEKPTYKEGERIYDLTDVVEEPQLKVDRGDTGLVLTPPKKEQTAGAALEDVLFPKDKKVYELSNLIDESHEGQIREEIRQKAVEIAEKVAREVMPGIVERVIREEIEKLKKA